MDHEKIWKAVLSELELTVSRPTFQSAFAKTQLLSLENSVATIGIANPVMRGMIETRYYSLIKSILDHHTKENTSLIFTVVHKKETLTNEEAGPLFTQQAQNSGGINLKELSRKLHLRPDASFDSFAVSPSNQL